LGRLRLLTISDGSDYFSPIPRLDLERIVYENKKTVFFLLLLLFAMFSLSQVFAAPSVKTVAIKVPFPDVAG